MRLEAGEKGTEEGEVVSDDGFGGELLDENLVRLVTEPSNGEEGELEVGIIVVLCGDGLQ